MSKIRTDTLPGGATRYTVPCEAAPPTFIGMALVGGCFTAALVHLALVADFFSDKDFFRPSTS